MGSTRQTRLYDGSVDYCGCGRTFVPTGEEEECPTCRRIRGQIRRRTRPLRTEDRETSKSDGTYGSLLWCVTQFNELARERNNTGGTTSRAFLTSQFGYKLFVQLYIIYNVLQDRQQFFLRPVILKGPNDAVNAWPFKEKITFKFIKENDEGTEKVLTYQPDPSSNCFKKPTSEMNVASAGIALPDVDQLYSEGFVENGTLMIICECQTSDLPIQRQDTLPLSCEVYEPSE